MNLSKRFKVIAFLTAFISVLSFDVVLAQEIDENSYNYNSVRPIRRADIMYKRTLWYRIDLREKQNAPFFSTNNEISKVIIDAVKAGVLRPFKNDSLTTRMSLQEFLENLKLPTAGGGEDDIFGGGDDWGGGGDDWGGGGGDDYWGGGGGDDWGSSGSSDAVAVPEEFFPNQLYLLELKEDLIFDRKRSRMYHDIQSIKLMIPAEHNPAGLEKPLATFSYKELVDNVFIDNPQAVWFNNDNIAESKNLADAFDLRFFHGRIVKYSNSKDNYIVDIYQTEKRALAKSLEYEISLLEYESELWSY